MNWENFLQDHSIEYLTRGPNTARNNISVKCPFCGEDDPSEHLGISLTSEDWGCLRNAAHRGHSPAFLISALLGCSNAQGRLIAAQYSRSDPDTLSEAINSLERTSEAPRAAESTPESPPEIRPIKLKSNTAKFWDYLWGRGFNDPDDLVKQYHLSGCLTGRYKDRLILPFYQNGELIAWTGRAITDPRNAPRYLSSSSVKQTVFNEDEVTRGGKLLFIVEGPFDALKLDYYGQKHGARTTCVFGTSISMDQIMILKRVSKRFERVVVLFDYDAIEPSFNVTDWLNVTLEHLPEGVKDPGELSPEQIAKMVQNVR